MRNSWKYHIIQTILLALPVCLSNAGHITVDLADNFFIGQLTEKTEGQAAVALAGSFYVFILVLAIGVSYGLTPIVAELHARGEHDTIGKHIRHAFVLNAAVSIVLFAVLFFCAPLLAYSGKPPEVTSLAIRFLNVIMLSMIPLSVFFTLKQFTEGMSDTRAAMYITIGSNILNILLNYILVFGKMGVTPMGVMGSCWATFISRVLMAIAMFLYVRYHPKYRMYADDWKLRTSGYERSIFKEHLRIGIPSGLMFAMEVAAFGIPTLFIPDAAQLAAHRISLTLAAMTYMVSSGLGAAATIRVGHASGLNDQEGARKAGFSALLLSVLFMAVAALLFIVFRHDLPAMFNSENDVLTYASALLILGAAFQIFDGTQVTMQGALRGLKDTLVPGYIAFVAYWIIALPVSWYLCVPMQMGATGVWFGFIAGLFASAAGFILRFHLLSRKAS